MSLASAPWLQQLLRWHAESPMQAYGIGLFICQLVGLYGSIIVFEAVYKAFPSLRSPVPSSVARRLPGQVEKVYWNNILLNMALNLFTSFTLGNTLQHRVDLAPERQLQLVRIAAQVAAMSVVADALLYWGHRMLHRVPVLWSFHSLHHKVPHPTARAVAFIHPIDSAVQQSLPIITSILLVGPSLSSLYVFLTFHLAETTYIHSGLRDYWLFSLLFVHWLPGRASASHHDRHHQLSNYCGHAKNLAEGFVLWDKLFATFSSPASRRTA